MSGQEPCAGLTPSSATARAASARELDGILRCMHSRAARAREQLPSHLTIKLDGHIRLGDLESVRRSESSHRNMTWDGTLLPRIEGYDITLTSEGADAAILDAGNMGRIFLVRNDEALVKPQPCPFARHCAVMPSPYL